MPDDIRNLFYLIAAVLFIFGIKGLAHPRTAVRGNLLGAAAMLLAVLVTLIDARILGWGWIFAGLILGSAGGTILAVRIQMTAMPQLVALFNGFGGAASLLVAGAALHEKLDKVDPQFTATEAIATAASGLIGAITFSGSLIAFGKLQEYKQLDRLAISQQKIINLVLAVITLVVAVTFMLLIADAPALYWVVVLIALVLGVTLVSPIGGADMPVVISLLNSYSGLAAASTGFVINNLVLIVAGALVGASGLILTSIMCRAMNRSLTNVLFGVMAEGAALGKGEEVYEGRIKATSADEIAMILDTARLVAIVPGYGMAVAQAQHAVRDLMHVLNQRNTEVVFAIHPVAGRMPGHMNVLLAEADVPYDLLKDLDESNSMMQQVDVALVIGANDVVNPDARENPGSPIAGMPIINVDQARTVVVIKRSLSPGFAGIPNPLFAAENTLMYFGDGKKTVLDLVQSVKSL